jgi:hypothetical protein
LGIAHQAADSTAGTTGAFKSLLNRVATAATAAKGATFGSSKAGSSPQQQEVVAVTREPEAKGSLSDSGYGASMWVLSAADLVGAQEVPDQHAQQDGAGAAAQQGPGGSSSQGKEGGEEEDGMLSRLVKSVANSKGVAGVRAWAAERASSSAPSFTRPSHTQQLQGSHGSEAAKGGDDAGSQKESSATREGLNRVAEMLQRGVRGLARDSRAPHQQACQQGEQGAGSTLHEPSMDEALPPAPELLVPSCGSGVVVAGSISTTPVPDPILPGTSQGRELSGAAGRAAAGKAGSTAPVMPPALNLAGMSLSGDGHEAAPPPPTSSWPDPGELLLYFRVHGRSGAACDTATLMECCNWVPVAHVLTEQALMTLLL